MFESSIETVLSAIVLVAGGILCVLVGKRLSISPLLTTILFVWHTALGTFYSWYALVYGGDPLEYYMRAQFDYVGPTLGTDFIVWITSLPVSLGFPFWPTSYLFNVVGALGLVVWAAALRDTGARLTSGGFGSVLTALYLFLPSLSFWTSGIGKDAISFLCVATFLWASLEFRERKLATVAAVLLMFPVRPHIAGLMLIGLLVGTVLASDLKASTRMAMTVGGAIAAFFAIPVAMFYAGTGQFSTIAEYIGDRQTKNLNGGSSLDITSMNPAMRLATFLYRPFPNEATALDQLAAAAENMLLIALTLFGIVVIYRAGMLRVFRRYGTAAVYGLLCTGLLSQVIANLGLATRQKWMAVPALMFVVLGAWQILMEDRARNRQRKQFVRYAQVAGARP